MKNEQSRTEKQKRTITNDNRERKIKNEQSRTGKQKRTFKDRSNDGHKTQHEKQNRKAQHRKLK
jgi:hypothetical protein